MNIVSLKSGLLRSLIPLAFAANCAVGADIHTRACYNFNEPGGLIVSNISPHGVLDGRLENGAIRTNTTQCGIGSAVCLDGVSGYVQLPADVLNNLPVGTFEASFRLESYDPTASFIVSKGDANMLTEFSISIFPPNQSPDLAKRIAAGVMGTPDYLLSSTRIELGRWYRIAFTWDGQFWRLYVNENLDAEMPASGSPITSTNGPTLGWHRHVLNPRFHGYIDDVKISDVAREFSPPVLFAGNGHYYKVFTDPMAWTQAMAFASSQMFNCLHGHLATITSKAENDFVAGLISGGTAWIGGVQRPGSQEPNGGWCWITEEPFCFTAWNTGEPNDGNPTISEEFLQLYGRTSLFYGTWNDSSDYTDAFVVEFEPLHVAIEVSQVEVCWYSQPNVTYQVEYRSDLTTNVWTALGLPVTGIGAKMCITDSTRPGPQKLYRVRELP